MRPELHLVALLRSKADVAGFAGKRHELALCLDQTTNAEARAWAKDRPRTERLGFPAPIG